jgi:hypothetical protein
MNTASLYRVVLLTIPLCQFALRNGMEEVVGSIPTRSTNNNHIKKGRDRVEGRRCNCVEYLGGTAPDGICFRKSTGTTSWEKARKFLARMLAEHDPLSSILLPSNQNGLVFMQYRTQCRPYSHPFLPLAT